MNTQPITIDVSKQPGTVQAIRIGQGDKNGTTIQASIYDNGSPLSLSGYSVRFEMRLPDGTSYYQSPNGTISGNVATIPIDETYAGAVDGVAKIAYIVVYNNSVVCSTSRINVIVLESAEEGADAAHAYSSGIIEATGAANAATAAALAAIEAMGDISELAVPEMSAAIRGGAKLGVGLDVSDGRLNIDLSDSASGSSVLTNGCALLDVEGDGWAEQDGTPTPENPVPVQVVEGRNLYNLVVGTNGNVTLTKDTDGAYVFNGTSTGAVFEFVEALPADIRTLSVKGDAIGTVTDTVFVRTRDVNNTIRHQISMATAQNWGYSTNSNAIAKCVVNIPAGLTLDNYKLYVQLEAGAAVTAYVPYGCIGLQIGEILTPIDLQGNVLTSLPDGTHDELKIDSAGHVVVEKRVKKSIFNGSEGWLSITAGGRVALAIADILQNANANSKIGILCDYFVEKTMNESYSQIGVSSNNAAQQIVFRPSTENTSVADWKTWLQTHNVTVYYTLATPTAIDLGYIDLPLMPDGCTVSIPELRNIGVEWLVTGADGVPEMALDERGRTLHEIALAGDAALSNVAPIESGKASTNYAVGSYLVHGGTLYRVTTAIATGEAITPGSNVTATTVMAELIRLTA